MMADWRLLLVSEPGRDGAFMVVRSLVGIFTRGIRN